jgi:protein tyrosine/serine phosphatase
MHWIDLEGAANVRDVGGMPTSDNRRTKLARLIRADNLQGLTPKDVDRLVADVGVATVVDLRSVGEVDSEGPGPLTRVPSVTHVHQSVIPEVGQATDAAADGLLARRERVLSHYPDDPVCAYYLGYITDRPDSIVGALRAVADSSGAALVHCAAGKDRTGVVIALALSIVGVDRDAIVEDYTASGDRIDAIMDRLRASSTYAEDIDKMPPDVHKPRAETMVALLRELDARYGGLLPWLGAHGYTDADAARLRAELV